MFFDIPRRFRYQGLTAALMAIELAIPSSVTAELACKLSADESKILIAYNSEIACGTLRLRSLISGIGVSVSLASGHEVLNEKIRFNIPQSYNFTAVGSNVDGYGFILTCNDGSGPIPCHRAIRVTDCTGSSEACAENSQVATTPSFLAASSDENTTTQSVLP